MARQDPTKDSCPPVALALLVLFSSAGYLLFHVVRWLV